MVSGKHSYFFTIMKKITAVLIFLIFYAPFSFAEISVIPYGAAETVSGSCFLVEAREESFLVDCGLFIGEDNEFYSNSELPGELVKAKALVLTHAHLDHSGRIPLLVSKGFRGKIYSTPATKELALSLFRNRNGFDIIKRKWFWSKLQKEKAERKKAPVIAHWNEECGENIKEAGYCAVPADLETLEKETGVQFLACKNCCARDSDEIEKLFETLEYGVLKEISRNVKFKLSDAGHIPGSACVIFFIGDKKILFSGDIGSGHSRLNDIFSIPEKADMIFMEATYAGSRPDSGLRGYDIFRNDLIKALGEGKTVWIPALAFNRTQKILFELKLMQKEGLLPDSAAVYSVSPGANNITGIYQKELKNKSGGWFSRKAYEEGSIVPAGLKQSKNIKFASPLIIISSSGDMDKGMSSRLAQILLPRKDVSVMIVNYVGPKSAAGLLLSKKKEIRGIKNNASAKRYDVFSDHADFEAVEKWLSGQDKKTPVYLIHSQKENAGKMGSLLRGQGWKNVSNALFKRKAVLEEK